MTDLPGKAIYDFHFNKSKKKLFIHDTFGPKVEMPVSYYFRSFAKMPELEKIALENCSGKILDIGAAAGSHALELQKKSFEVATLEISPSACEVIKERGVENVINEDYFKFSGEKFDTLLLLMNGVGISSTLDGFRRFLKKSESLLSDGGQIIFDSCDVDYMYEDGARQFNEYYGEINFRYEYGGELTDWFTWLYMDQETMIRIANESGFDCEILFEDENSQYLAKLSRKS